MLDAELLSQLAHYLSHVTCPVELVLHADDGAASQDMRTLLTQLLEHSTWLSLREGDDAHARQPSFEIRRTGTDIGVTFAAVPMGHEFSSLVLALLHVGGHAPKVDAETVAQIRALDGDFSFESYVSLTCQNCPEVVQALNTLSVINPRIRHVTIDGALFPEEVARLDIMAVPSIRLNGEPFGQGRMGIEDILAKLDKASAQRDVVRLSAKPPFDVLIVGGGPAGAAAAIYAARKGVRTGVVTQRFGGQVLDTLGIENFVSVPETDGPQFAAALQAHVRRYDVDIMNAQDVRRLIPAESAGGWVAIELSHGAVLKSRTVILATGARWREVNVPGEQTYRNRGVAYCPHCDGPLYKGKRVAVIGGGNSGVEAAIDLAGIAHHVTLLEYAPTLKADAVLVQKLKSLPNVNMVVQAQLTSIDGDGSKVNGLSYVNRETSESHAIELEGVFVQIGLVPNTEWVKGVVDLTPYGEMVVDAKGLTSLPGVFAAGDATTAPYKQIITAAGDGAKAALSAFEYLIRTPEPMRTPAPNR